MGLYQVSSQTGRTGLLRGRISYSFGRSAMVTEFTGLLPVPLPPLQSQCPYTGNQLIFMPAGQALDLPLQLQRPGTVTHRPAEHQLQWPFAPQAASASGTATAVLAETTLNIRR